MKLDTQVSKILEKLTDDENYYGKFGQQFLSNSDISILMKNPLMFHKNNERTLPMVVGSYFHTCILEPDKLHKFKIIESTTRNTKIYREMSEGEICLLEHEVDMIEKMRDKLLSNKVCKDYIIGNVQYEIPAITELYGNLWKGKADILNHNEKLVVDLKTTSNIETFEYSARKYNYNSQAYIYRELFGYDVLFMVIDKNTHQIGLFDCSDDFYESGKEKVLKATEVYQLWCKTEDFDPNQYFITKTL